MALISNKVLAVIVVLMFMLMFVSWFLVTVIMLLASEGPGFLSLAFGVVWFGFWYLVASRLYYCSC